MRKLLQSIILDIIAEMSIYSSFWGEIVFYLGNRVVQLVFYLGKITIFCSHICVDFFLYALLNFLCAFCYTSVLKILLKLGFVYNLQKIAKVDTKCAVLKHSINPDS